MARPELRRAENVPGELFVDSSCIDCDTCRWMAPETFARLGDLSAVTRQPQSELERQRAARALVACPTASIGGSAKADVRAARDAFPVPLASLDAKAEDDPEAARVLHCGYHAESSFGATSWFLHRAPESRGNVLIDSPRFSKPLVARLEALGGVQTMFLTHRDDVADHERFAAHFGCERVLHADDVRPGETALAKVEHLVTGTEALELDDELTVVPVPGHTRGSCCLSWRGRFLFTGDHLAWSARREDLVAFRDACWFDWQVQTESMERLAAWPFEWVLPGHGRLARVRVEEHDERMRRLVAWMRTR